MDHFYNDFALCSSEYAVYGLYSDAAIEMIQQQLAGFCFAGES
jgi:hypothetical protein